MNLHPPHDQIAAAFEQELGELSGTLHARVESEGFLFLRATLPSHREVKPGDLIRQGLAVRTTGSQIIVHPYTFREVCRNGAIHVDNLASRTIDRVSHEPDSFGALEEFRLAIRSGAGEEAFEANLAGMRDAMSRKVELALVVAAMVDRIGDSRLVDHILERYLGGSDRSGYGLMNAVTAVAREEPKPRRRWHLETVGGGILAFLQPPQPRREAGAEAELPTTEAANTPSLTTV